MPNTGPDDAQCVHVAVGVIVNRSREVLIARRDADRHQGGKWEFPGGKVAVGETVRDALSRELLEEVNIRVRESAPLMKIHHDYGDRRVLLDVWYVSVFSGTASGREGQPVKWAGIDEIESLPFPAANADIITALRNLLHSPGHPA